MTQLTPQEPPGLESVISTAELRRRPSRAPDYAAENHVLVALAREMAVAPKTFCRSWWKPPWHCATRTRPGSVCWTTADRGFAG
jgi:hypothetical protein